MTTSESQTSWSASTVAIHGDRDADDGCADIAPPIHVTTTFDRRVGGGYSYSREDQPTRKRLERVLGKMERGSAVAYASGQAAATAVLQHYRPGRIAVDRGYFGTHDAIESYMRLTSAVRIALSDEVHEGDVIWLETPKNPACELEDISAHATRARAAGAHVVVDSTLATPILQRPLVDGADVVIHSTTKYIGGHSDALGGVVVMRDGGRVPELVHEREISGAVPGTLETWLALRGLRTLEVRIKRQSETALIIADWLSHQGLAVSYPYLKSHPQHGLAVRQMDAGGGMVAFHLPDAEHAVAVAEKLTLFRRAVSLGGIESLVDWRHEFDAQCAPTLLRLSIGLEDSNDLIADLAGALQAQDRRSG